eukprot:Nitzschia sp. Nitz4//scaffold45_size130396//50918//52758//NITZ4_003444-RA/size130396-snap-gene-0.138-mRNA-1//-1//CDS//3329552383//1750//frame0
MGCQQSVPEQEPRALLGKTERSIPRPQSGNGGNLAISKKDFGTNGLTASSGGKGGPDTVSLEVDEDMVSTLPQLDSFGKLMPEEVVRRTSSSLSVSHIKVGSSEKGGHSLQVSYAYRSQRGYYPDDPLKANQDRYGITLNFAGEGGDAMFSVFDGHGTDGHHAAAFAKKKLPQMLAKHVRAKRVQKYMAKLKAEGKPTKGAWNPKQWPFLEADEMEQCCSKSFVDTNQAMHGEPSFDDKLCGTTAVAVVFHGGRMTVCNVGDSRVVLGHRVPSLKKPDNDEEEEKVDLETEMSREEEEKSGSILPIPLTRDQTPYRKDERERIKKAGGEVMSIDQKNGKADLHEDWGDLILGQDVDIHGDPPRIWVKGEQYPGTAFTRALGDAMAEDIGVIAEPEMITKNITYNDEYLVIASDGIFEFLTNQHIMNVCESSISPLEACERLTKEAYDHWLTYENRTDDITIIVCFLSSVYKPTAEEEADSTESLIAAANDTYGERPLRSLVNGSLECAPNHSEKMPEANGTTGVPANSV